MLKKKVAIAKSRAMKAVRFSVFADLSAHSRDVPQTVLQAIEKNDVPLIKASRIPPHVLSERVVISVCSALAW